jgi:hypothetical protein
LRQCIPLRVELNRITCPRSKWWYGCTVLFRCADTTICICVCTCICIAGSAHVDSRASPRYSKAPAHVAMMCVRGEIGGWMGGVSHDSVSVAHMVRRRQTEKASCMIRNVTHITQLFSAGVAPVLIRLYRTKGVRPCAALMRLRMTCSRVDTASLRRSKAE